MDKMKKLQRGKLKRRQILDQKSERVRGRNSQRINRQKEEFSKKTSETQRQFEQLQSRIEERMSQQNKVDPKTPGRDYWNEMRKLNQLVQRENMERINMISEHRRKRVWEIHSSLEARNSQQMDSTQQKQCVLRIQAMEHRENRESTCDQLKKMADTRPVKDVNQWQKVTQLIFAMNRRFDLGLKLRIPRHLV